MNVSGVNEFHDVPFELLSWSSSVGDTKTVRELSYPDPFPKSALASTVL